MKTIISKKAILFEGVVKPETCHVGSMFQPKKRKDQFGVIKRGSERMFRVKTEWGTLYSTHHYGNKKIRITVEVVRENNA